MNTWLALLLLNALALAASAHANNDAPVNAGEETVTILSHNQVCADAALIQLNDWVLLNFTATVDASSKAGTRGEVLQNSNDVGVPVAVQLKYEEIIPGWISGLVGHACEGSTIELLVPPSLGFGEDLTVRFLISIIQVSKEEIFEPSLFDLIDVDADGQISMAEFETYFKEKRKQELNDKGEPPLGLFLSDDVNQNRMLNWEEFSGPKGTQPPAVAAEVVSRERADPELSRFKKGDPLETKISIDLSKAKLDTKEDLEEQIREKVFDSVQAEFRPEHIQPVEVVEEQDEL